MGTGTLRRHRAARESVPEPVEPKGNGSTAEWAAWADHLGIEVPEGTKRDEIKALIAALPESPEGDPAPFDPAEHTVPEVRAYLDGLDDGDPEKHDAEVARILEAEMSGKNRTDLVESIAGTPADPENTPPVE